MQAGSFENAANREAITKGRTPAEAAPVVGASAADPSHGSSGAHVELQITAVNLAGSPSAVSESRQERVDVDKARTQQAETTAETRAAASLELSSEAQRLALIPAQVMDTDEIAEARKQVTEAQAKVAEAMDAQRSGDATPPSVPRETVSAQQTQRAAATQAALAHASNQADMTEAVVDMQQSAQRRAENSEPSPEVEVQQSEAPRQASAPVQPEAQSGPASAPPSEDRPDAMSALQGKSPFESSTPGSTGQSLDIVVGNEN